MKRLLLTIALLAIAVAVFAPAAQAERVLPISDAADLTKRVAKRDCKRDENCTTSDAANCRRLTPRRVSCVASNVGADRDGEYQCDRLVIVRLRNNGSLRHAKGKPSCYDL